VATPVVTMASDRHHLPAGALKGGVRARRPPT
jgi:hypothetical protein